MVVIGLLLILTTLTVMFLPNILRDDSHATAVITIQKSLAIARTQAIRDRRMVGLRLVPDTNGHVREMLWLERHDDLFGVEGKAEGDLTVVDDKGKLSGIDLTGREDDLIEVFSYGIPQQTRRLKSVSFDGTDSTFVLNGKWEFDIPVPTRQWKIMRNSMQRTPELPVVLPGGAVIDLSLNAAYPMPAGTTNADGSVDIVFGPTGVVQSPPGVPFLVLWVRDPEGVDITDRCGLVAVYGVSGAAVAHEVYHGPDPYLYVKMVK